MEKNKIYTMKLAKIYPLLVQKAERKNRSKEEVDEIIYWLTGYDEKGLNEQLEKDVDYETFFNEAPRMRTELFFDQGEDLWNSCGKHHRSDCAESKVS